MMTYNLTCDLAKPCTHKLEIPANTPYVLRLELFDNGEPHDAWDGNYGVGNIIPTASNYEAQVVNGAWVNSGSAFDSDWFGTTSSDVVASGNVVELKCKAHAKGAYGVKFMVNMTSTNWEAITTSTIEEGDADPRGASRASLVANFTSKDSCNPVAGGIEMTGTYDDDTEFSFTIGGVENEIH